MVEKRTCWSDPAEYLATFSDRSVTFLLLSLHNLYGEVAVQSVQSEESSGPLL